MLNVAIVGVGNISSAHVNGYSEFPERCRIVALVDIYPEKAHACNQERKLDAQVYNSHVALCERDDIDLVSVCTPPYTHAEIAIDLMRSGKNVLVEKPMASSLEECDQMIEVMKETGMRMSIISQNRLLTPVYNLKRFIDTDAAGKILHAQVDSLWWRAHSYYDLWWRGTWEKEGGGCTLSGISHIFATNTHGIDSPIELELVFENGQIRFDRNRLYFAGDGDYKLLVSDNIKHTAKIYWGISHIAYINNFYTALKMENVQISLWKMG